MAWGYGCGYVRRVFDREGHGLFGLLRLGNCFRLMVWLGDVAGLWGFDYRLRDVEVDRPGMLPGPAKVFALGLYDVTVCGVEALSTMVPGMYSSVTGDRNSTS